MHAVTDAAGAVAERYAYGAFGEPLVYDGTGQALTASVVGNPYLFAGREWDAETRFYNFRHRYLDPRQGRFITRDPLGLWADPGNWGNPYAYCANAPWTCTDPLGLLGGPDPLGNLPDWRDQFTGAATPRAGVWAIQAHANEPFAHHVRDWVEAGAAFYDGMALGIDWSDAYDPCDKRNQWANFLGQNVTISAAMLVAGPFVEAALQPFGRLVASASTRLAWGDEVVLAARQSRSLMPEAAADGVRVFWSGGNAARDAAAAFARAKGGVTLEMTPAGRQLVQLTEQLGYVQTESLWEAASAVFSQGASGTVHVFHNGRTGVRLTSVWRRIEYPVLTQQGNPIVYHVVLP